METQDTSMDYLAETDPKKRAKKVGIHTRKIG